MKTQLNQTLLPRFSWCALLMVVSALCGLSPEGHTQPSPVGTWDCVLSGNRDGTAYLTFFDDGTFAGYEALVPRRANEGFVEARNVGGDSTRTGFTTPTSTGAASQIFGADRVSGPWSFDNRGRTIGHFIEVSRLQNCSTNPFPFETNTFPSTIPFTATNTVGELVFCVTSPIATNTVGGITTYTEAEVCYTNIIICQAITNSISFVGKVAPGKRLTLICSTPFGNTRYRGVPARTLSDISGDYYATKKQTGISFQEFLSLTPAFDVEFPNIYDVEGAGPGYSYHGIAILSSRKRISFSFGMDPALPTDPVTVVRAVSGTFNAKRVKARTAGWDQPAGTLQNRARFDATRFAE